MVYCLTVKMVIDNEHALNWFNKCKKCAHNKEASCGTCLTIICIVTKLSVIKWNVSTYDLPIISYIVYILYTSTSM